MQTATFYWKLNDMKKYKSSVMIRFYSSYIKVYKRIFTFPFVGSYIFNCMYKISYTTIDFRMIFRVTFVVINLFSSIFLLSFLNIQYNYKVSQIFIAINILKHSA